MPPPAQAAPYPGTSQVKTPIYRNLTGGLNVKEAITDIADNEGAAVSNLGFYTAGALVRRGGWQKLIANTPTSNALLGIYQAVFNVSGTLTYYLVVTDGSKIWYTTDPTLATVTWTEITGTFTLDATAPYRFLMMNNIMVGYNGQAVFQWTGVGANIAAMPNAGAGQVKCPTSRIGIVWQNQLFWLDCTTGGTRYPTRTYFSNIGDPTTYPSANYIDIPTPNDGEQLTGASILYGNLILLKRFSIFILQGSPTSAILSRLNASVGCVEPNTVVQVDNIVYFISDLGFYGMNLFNVMPLGYKVEPRYLAANPQSAAANPMWAMHYKPKRQIFVAINCSTLYTSAGTQNDRIMAHDYFNVDANGNPTVSEYIAGYTHAGLVASKPTNPTGPSLMEQYVSSKLPLGSPGVIASFYDSWVYVMTEGSNLANGGPADALNWMAAATYPPTDFLTKFFDGGDPNSVKVLRWLWTTGAIYNNTALRAGILYNDSPVVSTFLQYGTATPTLLSSGGNFWNLGVTDHGALTVTSAASAPNGVSTIILQDQNGNNWTLGVTDAGVLTLTSTTATVTPPTSLVSTGGNTFLVGAAAVGGGEVITTTPISLPTTTAITVGVRATVPYILGGKTLPPYGKYYQVYFQNIGVLSQFSMDIIVKGRRL